MHSPSVSNKYFPGNGILQSGIGCAELAAKTMDEVSEALRTKPYNGLEETLWLSTNLALPILK